MLRDLDLDLDDVKDDDELDVKEEVDSYEGERRSLPLYSGDLVLERPRSLRLPSRAGGGGERRLSPGRLSRSSLRGKRDLDEERDRDRRNPRLWPLSSP